MTIADLEKLANGATPGPWEAIHYNPDEVEIRHVLPDRPGIIAAVIARVRMTKTWRAENKSNAEYIAVANPQTIINLCADIRACHKDLLLGKNAIIDTELTEGLGYLNKALQNLKKWEIT